MIRVGRLDRSKVSSSDQSGASLRRRDENSRANHAIAKPKRTFQFRTAPFRPRKKLPFHPTQIATLEIEWVRSLIILQMDFRQLNHLDRAAYP